MRTADDFKSMKGKDKITVLTAYNYTIAKILDDIGFDMILVGDSGVMVELGKDSTKEATMSELLTFTSAVRRGARNSFIISDMPIGSYTIQNAKKLLDSGANAVKVEGDCFDFVKELVKNNIDVMGHVGLTPQVFNEYKVQGKNEEEANKIFYDAIALEKSGAFSIVIECVPIDLAKKITESIKIPTIGIGAGPYCDGQVLVVNDLLGMYDKFKSKFVRRYLEFNELAKKSLLKFKDDIKENRFPTLEESFR